MKYILNCLLTFIVLLNLNTLKIKACCYSPTPAIIQQLGAPKQLAINSDGCLAIANQAFNIVSIFNNSGGCNYNLSQQLPSNAAQFIAFSPTGDCLVVGGTIGTVTAYPKSTTCTYSTTGIPIENATPTSLAISSQECLAVSYANQVRLYTKSPGCIYTFFFPPIFIASPISVAFSPDGSCLAVANNTNIVNLYSINNCSTSGIAASTIITSGAAQVVAFSPEGCLAIATNTPNIEIYSPIAGTCQYSLTTTIPISGIPTTIDFSSNSNCLAVGITNSNIQVFERTGLCAYNTTTTSSLNAGTGVLSLKFNANNCIIASDSTSGSVVAFTPSDLGVSISATTLDLCVNDTINLTAVPTGGIAPFAYSWAGPNGFTATTQSITIPNAQFSNQGAYVVTVTDSSANACTATTSALVTINDCDNLTINLPSCSFVNTNFPTITGQTGSDTPLSIFANGILIGSTISDSNGNYSFTPINALPDGAYTITVFISGTSFSRAVKLIIDTRRHSDLSKAIIAKYCPTCSI